jgi:serine/threonine protein kinase
MADIFAFGVILYIFAKGNPPFKKADIYKDPYYKTFILKPNKYWAVMDKDKVIGDDLRTLLQGCLALNE